METIKKKLLPGTRGQVWGRWVGGEEKNRWSTGVFRAVKSFCVIL